MSLDRKAYSLKKHLLYCTPTIVHLTCHLQVCRPQKSETTKCNIRSINQQPDVTHTVLTWLPSTVTVLSRGFYAQLEPSAEYTSLTHPIIIHQYSCGSVGYHQSIIIIHYQVIEPRRIYSGHRAYYYWAIVNCRTQRMMVVGYNGILFQDVGSVTQSLLGHYHQAPALGCITVRPKKGRQNVWSMIIIKPSENNFCREYKLRTFDFPTLFTFDPMLLSKRSWNS